MGQNHPMVRFLGIPIPTPYFHILCLSSHLEMILHMDLSGHIRKYSLSPSHLPHTYKLVLCMNLLQLAVPPYGLLSLADTP